MKSKVTLICVQPAITYYAWQVEVMLENFINLKIHEKHDIHCVFAYNKNEADWENRVETIMLLRKKYIGYATFYFYQDTRQYPFSYISSIRPNCLKQHFEINKRLEYSRVFYHDCDVVFTQYPTFLDNIDENDDDWYVSDTISYIGHDYIISKGEDVLDMMCDIVGINKRLVKDKQLESGGAQYLMKNVDYKFFDKVEKDCERMFKEITELNNLKQKEMPSYHELQIWCADMWCVLWNAWMRGYSTKIIPEMEFCWATDNLGKWKKCYLYHNAGVTHGMKDDYFLKSDFTKKYPYNIDFTKYKKDTASYKYAMMIKQTGKNSCL
jgi:hypothetical protein